MHKRYARHNRVAVFDTTADAEAGLETLDEAGFDAAQTSLLAPECEKRPGARQPSPARVHTITGIGPGLWRGLLVGTAIGVVLVGAATMVAAAVLDLALSLWAAAGVGAVVGATMGSVAGGLLGLDAAARKAAMWEQSLQPLDHLVQDGRLALVGVHSDDGDVAERGEEVLRQADPREVHALEAEVSFEPPARYATVAGRVVPSGSAEAPGAQPDGPDRPREADQADPTPAGEAAEADGARREADA